MKIKRIMIAAPGSGSGKTTVTCALLQVLKNRGEKVVSYKCGPDYIDPRFHEKVIGVPSYNLDTFFTGEEDTRALFMKHAVKDGFAVMEGVMGLYDGLGGIREEGSSYHLAKITKTPIVLVVDARGMGRSILPLIAGFLKYDTAHLVRGVLLNRISKGYFEMIKPLIEEELRLPVLGFLPALEKFQIKSRHLGLVLPNELAGIKEKIRSISVEFEKTVFVPSLLNIAEGAEEIGMIKTLGSEEKGGETKAIDEMKYELHTEPDERPVIAVAMDEAFCFYYEDNLLMLKENGTEIRYFSPLHDRKLPDVCHGLLIGGGYPELHAETLSQNTAMRMEVKKAAEKGMPIVAECGGFMYLHDTFIGKNGIRHPMAGVVKAECFNTGKLVRFGYIEMMEKESSFLPEAERIKGHEFHYYDSTDNGSSVLAIKPVTGRSYSCVMEGENYWMGFPHLYYPSNPAFAKSFVQKAARYAAFNDRNP